MTTQRFRDVHPIDAKSLSGQRELQKYSKSFMCDSLEHGFFTWGP